MSATGSIWMPLYIRDYLADTQTLTLEQSGAYLHCLMTSWATGKALPDDDVQLAAICRVTVQRWLKSLKAAVLRHFELKDDGYRQKRLEREREKAIENAQKRLDAAKKGGKVKSLKTLEVLVPDGLPPATRTDVPSPSPSQKEVRKEEISLPSVARRPAADKPVSKAPEFVLEPVAEQPGSEVVVAPAPVKAPSDAEAAVAAWNAMAEQQRLPKVKDLTDQRRVKLMKILSRHQLSGWRDMLDEIPQSEFALGINDSGWRINFDYVIRPEAFAKTLEGGHRRGPGPKPKASVMNTTVMAANWEDDSQFDDRFGAFDLTREIEHA